MAYLGEFLSLIVAVLWTASALSAEIATKRTGVLVLNIWRMSLALVACSLLLFFSTGYPLPLMAGGQAWLWLLLSGFVGYFLGDWCLFNSYLVIGSRFGQLFMTLAPAFTAFFAWVMIGQTLSWFTLLAMLITLLGIGVAVTDKKGTEAGHPVTMKGVLLGIGAALGQGLGLVMSKIGLDYFTANIEGTELSDMGFVMPFASNLIRCIAGLICYTGWLMVSRSRHAHGARPSLGSMLHDRKAMIALCVTLVSGPFLGVGLSLAAVQYTAAGIASTIMATTPILILLPSHWLFGQRITMRAIVGALISCVGVSLFFMV